MPESIPVHSVGLVSHARNIFVKAHQAADNWLKDMINPLVVQIQDKRDAIEQHMETLAKIKESKNALNERIEKLSQQRNAVEAQINDLKQMRDTLDTSTPPH